MADLTLPTLCFAEPGPQNTEATLAAGLERGRTLGLTTAVVATDTGKAARAAMEAFRDALRVVAVTNPAGTELPVSKLHGYLPRFAAHKQELLGRGVQKVPASLSPEVAAELEAAGATVVRMDWRRFAAYARTDLRAVERIGVGVRVALSVAVAAFLAGALPAGPEALAIAGTGFGGGGADTAIVLRPASLWADWRVLEILARPRESPPSEQ